MSRRFALFALLLATLTLRLVAPGSAHAAERQVTFDRAGRITRIDEALARRLGMFVERYEGFREARLFMVTGAAGDSTSDSTATNGFVLEITMLRGGQLLRERESYTADQVSALRADVESRLAAAAPERDKFDQEGRPRMLLGSATLGLGFYGWAVPYVFEVQDGSQAFGAYLLTAGASFFLPMMLTADAPVTVSDANLYWYGSTRGIVHGLLLNDAVQGDGNQGSSAVATAMIASLAEGTFGFAYCTQRQPGCRHRADHGDRWRLRTAVGIQPGEPREHRSGRLPPRHLGHDARHFAGRHRRWPRAGRTPCLLRRRRRSHAQRGLRRLAGRERGRRHR